jgi:hypothetical protein
MQKQFCDKHGNRFQQRVLYVTRLPADNPRKHSLLSTISEVSHADEVLMRAKRMLHRLKRLLLHRLLPRRLFRLWRRRRVLIECVRGAADLWQPEPSRLFQPAHPPGPHQLRDLFGERLS